MCGRRSPKAPLELVELLAGAMGDGGGFQRHGNAHLVQGVGWELNQGFLGGLNVAADQILLEVSDRYRWFSRWKLSRLRHLLPWTRKQRSPPPVCR